MEELTSGLLASLVFIAVGSANAAADLSDVYSNVKGYFKNQLTKVVCMAKRDCHQRVIYVINGSQDKVKLSGCGFNKNYGMSTGEHKFTHQKNSQGKTCTLSVHRAGKLESQVTLTPYTKTVSFSKQGKLACLSMHKVVKSWKKCPKFCGRYNIMGYISVCSSYN